jgi:hypothetical protein
MGSQGYYEERRQTLFNIYSFAEHQTIRNATPELIIQNSDFEYFLAETYESLITIESYSMTLISATEKSYIAG